MTDERSPVSTLPPDVLVAIKASVDEAQPDSQRDDVNDVNDVEAPNTEDVQDEW
jgi:hypothetical protein